MEAEQRCWKKWTKTGKPQLHQLEIWKNEHCSRFPTFLLVENEVFLLEMNYFQISHFSMTKWISSKFSSFYKWILDVMNWSVGPCRGKWIQDSPAGEYPMHGEMLHYSGRKFNSFTSWIWSTNVYMYWIMLIGFHSWTRTRINTFFIASNKRRLYWLYNDLDTIYKIMLCPI